MATPLHIINANPRLIFQSDEALVSANKALRVHFEGSTSRHARKQADRLAEQLTSIYPALRRQDFYFLVNSLELEKGIASSNSGLVLAHAFNWVARQPTEVICRFFREVIGSVTLSPRPTHRQDHRGVGYQTVLTLLLACMHGVEVDGKILYIPRASTAIIALYFAAKESEEARELIKYMYLLFYLAMIPMIPEIPEVMAELGEKDPSHYYWKPGPRLGPQLTAIMQQIPRWCDEEQAELYSRFADKTLDDLQALITLLWEDIELNRRYGIREEGADRYRVTGLLGETSAANRYFLKEGCQPPAVCAVYERPFLDGTLYEMRDLSLEELDDVEMLDNIFTPLSGRRDIGILNFVVDTIVYHRIVCHEVTPRTARGTRSTADRERARYVHEKVRAHFRQLREGREASPERIEAAMKELGRRPAAGLTFVSGFSRDRNVTSGGTVQAAQSTEPIFTVSIEDVVKWLT